LTALQDCRQASSAVYSASPGGCHERILRLAAANPAGDTSGRTAGFTGIADPLPCTARNTFGTSNRVCFRLSLGLDMVRTHFPPAHASLFPGLLLLGHCRLHPERFPHVEHSPTLSLGASDQCTESAQAHVKDTSGRPRNDERFRPRRIALPPLNC